MRPTTAALLVGGVVMITFMIARRATAQDVAQPELPPDVACHEPALPDTFFARPEGVVLRVGVTDRVHRPLGGLTPEDFAVREDGRPQRITFFSNDDGPVSIGLVIDAGSSAAATHADAVAAGLALARASRTDDEFFAVAFNDHVHDLLSPDFPFTHDPEVLRQALLQVPAGGRSAFNDAVAHALDYAARAEHDQRVLILISNGHDTASTMTFAQLAERVVASPTVVFAIGLFTFNDPDADALNRLAYLSGGEAFFTEDPGDLRSIVERIARDIRTTYTIGYIPPDPGDGAKFREVDIVLPGAPHDEWLRYRHGYVGGSR